MLTGRPRFVQCMATPLNSMQMVAPPPPSDPQKREKMAVTEAAISSALSHPNILQVRA